MLASSKLRLLVTWIIMRLELWVGSVDSCCMGFSFFFLGILADFVFDYWVCFFKLGKNWLWSPMVELASSKVIFSLVSSDFSSELAKLDRCTDTARDCLTSLSIWILAFWLAICCILNPLKFSILVVSSYLALNLFIVISGIFGFWILFILMGVLWSNG